MAQFSAEQWGVVMKDEVSIHETKTFQLPVGIEKEDRCMGAGIQASMLFKAPYTCWILGVPRLLEGAIFSRTMGCYGGRWGGHT